MATSRIADRSVGMERYQQAADAFAEAFGVRHDARAAAALYAEDGSITDMPTGDKVQGRVAIEEYLSVWLRAFPDLTFEPARVFGSGDMIAVEWVSHGTHTGPLATPQGEIAATGKRAELRACSISRLTSDDLYAEDNTYFDSASLLQQLGVM